MSRRAKLDYRHGYFAEKEFGKFTSADKEDQLQQALILGDPITDLTLAAEVNYFRLARDRYFVPFSVKIPGSEIALAKTKGNAKTDLDFIGQLRDNKDQMRGEVRDGITIPLAQSTLTELNNSTIAYDTGFTVPPGTYKLKFLTRENETGKMGTYEKNIVIPDLAADQPTKIKTSSIVLSSQRQPLKAAAGKGGPEQQGIAMPIRWWKMASSWCPASPACSAKTRTCTCTWKSTIRRWAPTRSQAWRPPWLSIAARTRCSNRSPSIWIASSRSAARRCQ